MSEAVFLVPTVLWQGAAPTAPDLASAEAQYLVWQLAGALLLLELAGYQAREVVIDVPDADATGTDLVTGTTGPPGHGWAPAGAPGKVGIFVGPRTGLGALEAPASGRLTLQPVILGESRPDAPGLVFGFTPTRSGWLTLPVLPDADLLYTGIAPAIDALVGTLRGGITAAYQASPTGPGQVPAPGLLSMLDPATWNVSSGSALPDPAAWTRYGPTLVSLGRTVRQLALDSAAGIGLDRFLAQEASTNPAVPTLKGAPPPPDPRADRRHSVLERLLEAAAPGSAPPVVAVQPGQWLADMYAALRPQAPVPVAVGELDWLTWTQLLMILHRVGVVDFLSYRLAPDAGDLYGGKDLRIGDTDAEVGDLQRDLRALGYALIDPAETTFGLTTDWAVREFQCYATMPNTARWLRDTFPYADGLEQVPVLPEQRYGGEPTGLVDKPTRDAIATWKQNNWRCPVVAEGWRMSGFRPVEVAAGLDNVWKHDQVPVGLRVYVRDFTGTYDVPATRPPAGPHVVGRDKSYPNFGGPEVVPDGHQGDGHCWPEAEMMPELTGDPQPTGAPLSTYKVVRMVAEVECYAYLDSINGYDRGVVSLGPCHWTFGLIPDVPPAGGRDVGPGELAGFLAYVAERYPDTFQRAVRRFGLQPAAEWGSTGQPYLQSLRTYAGRMARLDAAGQWQPLPSSAADQAETIAETYKSWPWIYRWQMAARTMPEWGAACWDFVRIRLRDLLSTPWGSDTGDGGIADPPNGPPVTIGAVFTSERTVAMVLRWHVNRPSDVVASSLQDGTRVYSAADALRQVYVRARARSHTMPGPLSGWTAADEVLLIEEIVAQVPGGDLKTTMKRIQAWPKQLEPNRPYPRYYRLDPADLGTIGQTRGSSLIDESHLPSAPDYGRVR